MVLPLVPLVIGISSSITGGVGVVAGTVGGVQIRKAKTQIDLNHARREKRRVTYLAKVDRTSVALKAFGQTQELAQRDVIFRMEDFLVSHGKQVRANERLILDGVDALSTPVPGMAKLDPDVVGWVRGVFGSAVAAAATPVALRAAAKQLAKASTGTAMSTLSGAALERAILAFFGGGSRAAGGGGMDLGTTMLNVAGAGAGLFIAGVTVKNQGTKARTVADEHRAEVDVEVVQLDRHEELLRGVRKWAREQNAILTRLVSQATETLDILESEPFNIDLHAERLQAALILVTAAGQLAIASAVYEDGNLDANTEQLNFKYRDANTETTDD